VREAVPAVVKGAVAKPVPAGEVDDHGVGGRLEGRRLVVPETDEEHVGAARQRVRIRDERRQRAVQPDVES
jgi:hypothetical protein